MLNFITLFYELLTSFISYLFKIDLQTVVKIIFFGAIAVGDLGLSHLWMLSLISKSSNSIQFVETLC